MSRIIQLAWFSAASARYLDLGLTAEQRLSVFQECSEIAMSHGDSELNFLSYSIFIDFLKKKNLITEYLSSGEVHLQRNEYDDAIYYFTKGLLIANVYGDKLDKMSGYLKLGNAHLKKEEYDDAISNIEKYLDIAQECGDNAAEIKNALMQLGAEMKACNIIAKAHLNKKNFDDAILFSKRCLAIAQECGDKVQIDKNEYLLFRDPTFKKQECDYGLLYNKKWVAIAQKCDLKLQEMNAYMLLAEGHLDIKMYDDAILSGEKCLAIAQECGDKVAEMTAYMLLGNAHLDKCLGIVRGVPKEAERNTLNGILGIVHLNKEEYDDAISYSKKCLAIAQEFGDKKAEKNSYMLLGIAHLNKEEYDDAISYGSKCLAIAQECGDKETVRKMYVMLGNAHLSKEEYDDAISYRNKCLAIAQECGDREAEMNAYLRLGNAHLSKEEYDDAISYSKKGLAIARECGDKKSEMNAYLNLGKANLNKEEYGLSYSSLTQGLRIAEELKCRSNIWTFKFELRIIYRVVGMCEDNAEDKEYFDLSTFSRNLDDVFYYSVFFAVYSKQFSRHVSQQELQEASLCVEKAIEVTQNCCTSLLITHFKCRISEMYTTLHQYDKSEKYYQEALDLAIAKKNNSFQAKCHFGLGKIYYYFLNDVQKAKKSFEESIKNYETLFDNLGQNDQFKIAFVEKCLESYQMLLKVLIQESKKEEALLISERYRAKALKDLLISGYGMKTEENGKRILQYSDVQTLVSSSNYTLLYYSTCHGELYTFIIEKDKELELSVQHFGYCDTHLAKLVDNLLDEMKKREGRSLEAMVDSEQDKNPPNPTQDELTQVLRRVKEKRLSEQCRTICSSSRGDPVENSDESSMESPLKILHNKLIHNAMTSINQDEIVIIPEGPLNKIPFAALQDPDTEQYLSESKRIRLAPSMTTLKLIQECPTNYQSMSGALIIGNPLVGLVKIDGKEEEIKPLPYALEEAEVIAQILLPTVTPLLKDKATKPEVIKEMQKGVSVIHIAAHGSLEKATILLAPTKDRETEIPEERDYMLTIADVQRAQVRAQLVVLSCCYSGRGEIRAEGVIGMCRAFLASGSRAVVASLWDVDDKVTGEFMKTFYGYLKKRKSASTSLHLTMEYLRTKYTTPAYWAPFFLMGDDVTLQL